MSDEDIFLIVIFIITTLNNTIYFIINKKKKKNIIKQAKKLEPRLHKIDSKTKKIKDILERKVK